ncbi:MULTISPECIES: patatin-like phospholipase family protein [Zobellia]|uniref:Patatin-like phospholipase n=2 Tax=Zobellia galactanivorans (strain DSM 12802 / CCUG 47099 / CIP 106680 / NCIMB 13871 / Dsij) TaxID=63186 RepID=G0LAR1_ZOBGA|nr:Patatin-like phospholipase [Zobellia galactanivorans]
MKHFIKYYCGLRFVRTCMFLLCLFFVVGPAMAQPSGEDGIKVGLVLSGGGAKGMAHIGAIKVIEEAGIKIDYIGGTSMGAIVGSLYAAGYTGDQLDSIFRATDFTNLIQDNLPRSAKTFYEKENSEKYAITLPFDGFKVSVPPAYSGGQNVYNELVKFLYPVRNITKFDELPIPFVCIATDVETGNEVILKEGYLPEAVMASGTLPSLFEPAKINGKVLIDGGVVNNYPIDEVKEMGADIVIGVDVQHGLRNRESLLTATEILLQINNYRTVLDMKEKSKKTDIYIKPNMSEFSMMDFDLHDVLIKSGEDAALKNIDALKALAEKQKEKPSERAKIVPSDTLSIDRLIIRESPNYSRGYVKGKLRFDTDKPTTFSKLQQGISNLAATGNFQTIHYQLRDNDDERIIELDLDETKTKSFIRLGAHYDNLYKTAAILNYTRKSLITRDDVSSFDFIVGDNLRYNLQYYVDKGFYWSFGFNSRFNKFEKEVNFDLLRENFDVQAGLNVNTINMDVTDLTNQVYVQTVLREEFAFRMGLEHKFLKYTTKTLRRDVNLPAGQDQDERTIFEKSNFYSAFGQLTFDTYNDKYFPSKGLYFDGDFHFYVLSSDFNDNFKEFSIAKARAGLAIPLIGNLSLNTEIEGGFKLGTSNVTSFDFVLGGYGTNLINNFRPFFGYDFLSLPGNAFVKGYGRLDLEFAPKNHFMFTANYANVDDDLFRTGEWFDLPIYSGYGVGYGWESFLGPLQVHYTWTPEGSQGNFFFSFGYWF